MSPPSLAFVLLAGDPEAALARVPAAAGVGQILGPEGRSLVLATASNLRKWAGSHLGLGRPTAAGRRPKTNLAPIATAIGWVEADAPFRQRLLFERLMAPLVPPSARRDLKPPAFLHLDRAERFPRLTVRGLEGGLAGLYGPFRDRRAAERARDAIHRLFPLRPCDASFEPDPALPLGLACLYAQVRSCAAPCLARVSEEEYRALARRCVQEALERRGSRESLADGRLLPVLAPHVAAADARAVVVDPGRSAVTLFPIVGGRVLDHEAVTAPPLELEAAVARLSWPGRGGPDDWLWLSAWLRTPKGRASYVVVPADESLERILAATLAALPPRFAASARGGNVGALQGKP